MSRIETLFKAIEIIQASDCPQELREELEYGLGACVRSFQRRKWTREEVVEACDRLYGEKGYLVQTDFVGPDLPCMSVVKKLFGLSVTQFRDKYYPHKGRVPVRSKYSGQSVPEMNEKFRQDYLRTKPTSATAYNKRRDKGLPSAQVMIKLNGAGDWRDLLEKLGLPTEYCRGSRSIQRYSVTTSSVSGDKLAQLPPMPDVGEWGRKRGK